MQLSRRRATPALALGLPLATRIATGMLAVTLAGAIARLDVAHAQTQPPQAAPRTGDRLSPVRPNGFTTTVRPATRRGASEDVPSIAAPDQPTPADDPNGEQQQVDPDAVQPPLRFGRRPIVDGDPTWPPEPQQPRDGVLEPEEPGPIDGVDPNTLDLRDEEDIAAFEKPAAGFDPQLFSIETDPILDRRPTRLARFEPFQPVGIHRGGFIIFPEAEFTFGAFNNLFRSTTNTRRDIAFDVRPTIRVVSNWRTHAMEFRATGLSTFYNHFPGEDNRAYTLELRNRLDVTRRTNIETLVSRDHAQEVRGSINAGSAVGPRADIDTTRVQLAVNHRFNKLALQLRGGITDSEFSTSNTRDNQLKETAVRATWYFKPTFGVFSEAALNGRSYAAVSADGVSRDSTGTRVRAGIAFGTTSQKLRGEVSVGRAEQSYESHLPTISGLIVDANVAWRMNGFTSLLLTARSDIAEAFLPNSGGALSQSAGAEVRHAFRRNLIGTAGVTLQKLDYEGVSLQERSLTGLAGLEYFVNREVTVFGRFQHVHYESTDALRNYDYDEVKVGVRVRR